MKRKFYFFLLLFLLVFIPYNVKAECDDSENIRLSKLAQNVKISYTYDESQRKFSAIITNSTKELTIKYLDRNDKYVTNDEINITSLSSGNHTFMIYANSSCSNEYILTKYLKLPFYNMYYQYNQCNGIENYYYCSKWVKSYIGLSEFLTATKEYKEKIENQKKINTENINESYTNKILTMIKKIYIENYIIILLIFISILCLIIYIKNKRDSIV